MPVTAPAPAWEGGQGWVLGQGLLPKNMLGRSGPPWCAQTSAGSRPACMAMLAAVLGSARRAGILGARGRHPRGWPRGCGSASRGPRTAQGRPRRRRVRVLAARARGALFALRRGGRRPRGLWVVVDAQLEVARRQARRGDRVREAQRGLDVDRRAAAGARCGRRAVRRARVCARRSAGRRTDRKVAAHTSPPSGWMWGICSLSACGERPDMQTCCCSASSSARVPTPVLAPHRPTCYCTAVLGSAVATMKCCAHIVGSEGSKQAR